MNTMVQKLHLQEEGWRCQSNRPSYLMSSGFGNGCQVYLLDCMVLEQLYCIFNFLFSYPPDLLQ